MSHWLTISRTGGTQQAARSIGSYLRAKSRQCNLAGFKTQATTPLRRPQKQLPCRQHLGTPFTAGRLGIAKQHIQTRSNSGSSAGSSNEASITSSTVEHSPGQNVATITVSNPRKLNIVNSPLLGQLITTCQELSNDDNLRVVVLTGAETAAGKPASFIGGADIKEMSQMNSYEQAHKFITHVHNACEALRDIPVPVIARIHGFCLGAGMEIAASCDLRIATKDSVLGMPEVKIGLPSIAEAAYLPILMGFGRARRFLYLAENISGTEAEKWGLVEKLVDDDAALNKATEEWISMLVQMGPKCIRSQKTLMKGWESQTPEEGIQAGIEALGEAFRDGGKEPRGLMQGFLNRKR